MTFGIVGYRSGVQGFFFPASLFLAQDNILRDSLLTFLLFLLANSLACNPGTPAGLGEVSPATGLSGPRAEEPGQADPQEPTGQDPVENVAIQQPKAPAEGESGEPALAGKKKKHTNRLVDETSPYLLMHAHNPVDWYPWGEEAFEKAKKENKVVFLSIGYSSCHWCHVMEHESFMDEEIAKYLNEHFVCIKVDREERPDIDQIYMRATVMINGRGGWPMSVFMTPKAEPFFGGSYFPARDGDREGIIGFLPLTEKVQQAWKEMPEVLQKDGKKLAEYVKADLDGRRPVSLTPLGKEILDNTVESLQQQFDAEHGGFGFSPAEPMRPKFPSPSNLDFLVYRLQQAEGEIKELPEWKMLARQLDRMAMGGIRDHLGGGFHRYSVDRFWLIPHFEKMLYDNGQLASVYSEAYKLSGDEEYRLVVQEILDFVEREMTGEKGGFYSALDADSEGEEGRFYRWEKQQLEESLEAAEYSLFAGIYGINDGPNFEQEYYVPFLSKTRSALATGKELSHKQLEEQLRPVRQKLFTLRAERVRPFTDDKILTSWNGLMIRGFADAGRLLEQPGYIETAEKAATFVLEELSTKEGRLLRTYRDGEAKLNAYVVDYAFLVEGLIALHRATDKKKWLDEADRLMKIQLELFWDDENSGFFFTSDDHESLLARGKNPVDGAQPSGNSVSVQNLIYLAGELDNKEYLEHADGTIRSVSGILSNSPSASPRMVIAVGQRLDADSE